MPTVFRESGFRFMIYTEDHAPMHVHAWYQGRQVIINFEGNVAVRENYGLNHSELRRALSIVRQHQTFLQNYWREIHG